MPSSTPYSQLEGVPRPRHLALPLGVGVLAALQTAREVKEDFDTLFGSKMPRIQIKKKKTKSRPRRAGAPVASPSLQVGQTSLLALPQTQRRILPFAITNALTSTTGAYTEETYVMNSAYHVDGSTSAKGYSTYMGLYSKCFVVGATIRVVAHNVTNNPTDHCSIGVTITTNSSSLATTVGNIQNGMCSWTTLFKNPDRADLVQRVDVAKFFNKPKVLDDSQLFCTATTQPTQQIVAHVFAQDLGSATSLVGVALEILLDCIFTDPIPFS